MILEKILLETKNKKRRCQFRVINILNKHLCQNFFA